MCTRGRSPSSQHLKMQDEINQLCHNEANLHCVHLLDSLTDKQQELTVDALRTAFVSYLDAFQSAFRSEIGKRLDNSITEHEQEPWFTDYVTLKPLVQEDKLPGSSRLVAKAQKITKKACVLLSNNNQDQNHEDTCFAG